MAFTLSYGASHEDDPPPIEPRKVLAATDQFWLALPCVFVAGAAMTITGTGAQTLIQAAVDAKMRGRVMALYGMIFRSGPA